MGRYVDVDLIAGKKKIGLSGIITVLAAAFVIFCLCVIILVPGRGFMTVSKARKGISEERYIIHAGGDVTDENGRVLSYTNSLEALNNCYEKGNRIAEFDFMITSDDKVVCAHNSDEEGQWAHGISGAGYGPDYPATFSDFMNAKFEGSLTTMSLDDLAAFMIAHKDFVVVTDVKDDNEEVCRVIRRDYPDLTNSFIIQIYHPEQYEKIKALGFSNIIYTLYEATDEEFTVEAISDFLKKSRLVGVTVWKEMPEDYPDRFEALSASKIPICVHTVNDADEMKKYFDMGISAIYTDVTDKDARY